MPPTALGAASSRYLSQESKGRAQQGLTRSQLMDQAQEHCVECPGRHIGPSVVTLVPETPHCCRCRVGLPSAPPCPVLPAWNSSLCPSSSWLHQMVLVECPARAGGTLAGLGPGASLVSALAGQEGSSRPVSVRASWWTPVALVGEKVSLWFGRFWRLPGCRDSLKLCGACMLMAVPAFSEKQRKRRKQLGRGRS